MLRIFGISLAMLLLGTSVFADGRADFAEPEPTPNQASDASFDKRLPPVLPGEEVSDGNRTMRVWSSAGPVPVARPPEPFENEKDRKIVEGIANGGINVVIDGRKDAPARPPRPTQEGSAENGGSVSTSESENH